MRPTTIKNTGWFMALAACGLVSLSLGCREATTRTDTVPVHGTVTLDGKPLPYGHVVFQPLSGHVAKGAIKNGQFTLGTYEAADGAVLGQHRVSVTAKEKLEGEDAGELGGGLPRFGPSLIPKRYGNNATSTLEFEIHSGPNQIDIDLFSEK